MSESDRERWNEKHAGAPDREPEPFVAQCLPFLRDLPAGVPRTALDVACGAGRHAVLLAREGFDVLGVDISDVGLSRLLDRARLEGLRIRTRRMDLDSGCLPEGSFGVVLCIHHLERALWPALRQAVAPGGMLVFQTFTRAHAARTGFPERYCLERDEIVRELAPFGFLLHRIDDDASRSLESVLARRPA